MLIKKNLKNKKLAPCLMIFKLKQQPSPFYPTCKKQRGFKIPPPRWSFSSPLLSKIGQALLESRPCGIDTKRQAQNERNNTLRSLYPINFLSFQRKSTIPRPPSVRTVVFTLTDSKKDGNINPLAQPLEKGSQLKIILKSYSSQLKDIEASITAVSKLVHYFESCCVKQLKTFLTNSFYSASLAFRPRALEVLQMKSVDNSNNVYPRISSTFSLLSDFKMWLAETSFQKKQKSTILQISLNSLVEQPLIELLGRAYNAKGQGKNRPAFLLTTLQKINYCNRYFFKTSALLNSKGPIHKQVQKTYNSTQLFTVIRSPFVFKKTREQFIKRQLSRTFIIKYHSPIQKQLFIQCLSLLRLPVELEIHC